MSEGCTVRYYHKPLRSSFTLFMFSLHIHVCVPLIRKCRRSLYTCMCSARHQCLCSVDIHVFFLLLHDCMCSVYLYVCVLPVQKCVRSVDIHVCVLLARKCVWFAYLHMYMFCLYISVFVPFT